MTVIEAVSQILESIGAPYALIGARAVGARGYPRMTLDYDFLTSDARVLEREVWKALEERGAMIDPRKGDFDDPIAGVVHISFADGVEADVLLAKWKWESEIIERSERSHSVETSSGWADRSAGCRVTAGHGSRESGPRGR